MPVFKWTKNDDYNVKIMFYGKHNKYGRNIATLPNRPNTW